MSRYLLAYLCLPVQLGVVWQVVTSAAEFSEPSPSIHNILVAGWGSGNSKRSMGTCTYVDQTYLDCRRVPTPERHGPAMSSKAEQRNVLRRQSGN